MSNLFKIDEQQAKYVSLNMAGLLSERLMVRRFDLDNETYIKDLTEVLRKRVSLLNPDNGNKFYTVTDPKMGHIVYPGVWRLISVKSDVRDGVASIIQTLAYGYAQSLVDADARLVGGPSNPIEPIETLKRQWVALDFLYLGTMLEGLSAQEYVTDLVIEGHTYEGNWRAVRYEPGRADDGSGVITQTLVAGWVKSADALPVPVLLKNNNELLSPFMHDTDSERTVIVQEYRGIDPAYATTLRDTIALASDCIAANIVKADDGSCSIQKITETRDWAGDLTQEWSVDTQSPTFDAERIITRYSHIPPADLIAAEATLGTATAGYAVTLLKTDSAQEGFHDLTQQQDKVHATVTTGNGVDTSIDFMPWFDGAKVVTTTWINVKDSELAAALVTLTTAPSGYTVLKLQHGYNGTGLANISRVMALKGDSDPAERDIEFPTFDSERITIYYFGLSPADAATQYETAKTTLPDAYYPDPLADPHDPALAPIYKIDGVSQRDGPANSITVVQQISKIMALTAAEWGTFATVDAEGVLTGIEFDYFGDSERHTTTWLHVPDAYLSTVLTTLSESPTGYKVLGISHSFNGTGSANVTRIIAKTNTTGFNAAIQFPSYESERVTFIYMGYDVAAGATKYTELQTTFPAGYTSTTYKIDSVTQSEGKNGSITLTQQLSKLNPTYTSHVNTADYTVVHGRTTINQTVILNVKKANLTTAKDAILADAAIIVLTITDNDNGQGAADITYRWRLKPASPETLGKLTGNRPQFRLRKSEKTWHNVNLTSATALSDAVTLALNGTAPYAPDATERVLTAAGQDRGDKTGVVTQQLVERPAAAGDYAYADYQLLETINPHGLQSAEIVVDVREYVEVDSTHVTAVFALLRTFLGGAGSEKGNIQVQLSGDGLFNMRALKQATPTWDNTAPAYVQTQIRDAGGFGETKVESATGVPVGSAAAIVAAVAADPGYTLQDVSFVEQGQGNATINKVQQKDDGTVVTTSTGGGFWKNRLFQRKTWHNVAKANVATIFDLALTDGVTGYWQLMERTKRVYPNGNADIHQHLQIQDWVFFSDVDSIWGALSFKTRQAKKIGDGDWRLMETTVQEELFSSQVSAKNHASKGGPGSGISKFGWYLGILYWRSRRTFERFSDDGYGTEIDDTLLGYLDPHTNLPSYTNAFWAVGSRYSDPA